MEDQPNKSFKIGYQLCTIDSTGNDQGYMYVKCNDGWIELWGNEDQEDKVAYPIAFETEEEIDEFCANLKILLNGSK